MGILVVRSAYYTGYTGHYYVRIQG